MKVKYRQWKCATQWAKYGNGRTALILIDENDEFDPRVATATVNIPEFNELQPREILIKEWSENEGMMKTLVGAGVVTDTFRLVPAGHSYARVALLTDEAFREMTEALSDG